MFGRHHEGHGDRESFRGWGRGREHGCAPGGRRGRDGGFGDEGGGEFFGRGGWFGGRGGRVFGHGDLRLVILALIAEKPRHGYDLIRAIEEKFGGAYAPSPGAVYPTLTLLEEQDHIRGEASSGTKKLYAITPEGEAFLAQNRDAVDGVMARMDLAASAFAGHSTPDMVREAYRTLKHALHMRRGPWTPAEAERVRTIIDRAARDIVGGKSQD
ncbi:PadR family transcriptional regulator [Labrys monachus]|uniref:DNA-binding PadR family transcriptional regulator n=1 Tax=Labrys monachus TaxID=217067 RepID=A0ABU0F6V0_9HYPH|nr:PadR family transcriptional regulator [Labrys monachus]MDQ0390340.1 DNA-binding PadR family transcriptional regulator [Labrys monachus]